MLTVSAPDQLLDVDHVTVCGVLRRGRSPKRALLARARRLESLPDRAAERGLEVLVGELRVGDSELARELIMAKLAEAAVGLGVDPGDEERGDGADTREVAAAGLEPREAA